jgi:hypothetical protein
MFWGNMMNKFIFVGVFGLLSMAIFAQDWTVDGSFYLNFYKWSNKWDNGSYSEDTTDFSLSVRAGKYITDKLNTGLRVGFGTGENGSNFTIGPYLKFDFYEYEKIYFAVTSGVYYTRYNGSYSWNDDYPENDANRILLQLAPSVTYMVNENMEVYWQFATLYYRHDWLTLKNTNLDCEIDEFRINGPFTNPTFGLIFRF